MKRKRQGFILVAALWLLVALGAVGVHAAVRSKARRVPAANLIDQTRARQAALAGGDYARSRLTAALRAREMELRSQLQQRGIQVSRITISSPGQATNPWREPQQLIESGLTLDDLQFELNARDAGASLNINSATEQMLRQFFGQGMGLDYPTADLITQAMLDWRDQDELPRLNGGEREEYVDAGAAVLPANRRFADVDELRHVRGMTSEILEQIRPFVTVVGSGRINVNAAPEQVLCALPGFRPAQWAQLVRQRSAGRYPSNVNELRRMFGASEVPAAEAQEFNRRVSFTTTEVVVVSEGSIPNSPVRARVTMVLTQTPNGAAVTWQKVE